MRLKVELVINSKGVKSMCKDLDMSYVDLEDNIKEFIAKAEKIFTEETLVNGEVCVDKATIEVLGES